MLEQSWFYNLILVVYAGTVFLYCIDFLHHNRKANQTAFWLLSIVWGLQTFYLIYNALRLQALPFFSQGDTLFFYSWLLISLSLIINGLFKMDFLLFFANLVGFTVLSFSLFEQGGNSRQEWKPS
jgi:HemX protein